MLYIHIYLVIINAVSFLLMLTDKYKAKKNLWRIPEKVLLCIALAGGSLGALIGMHLARHKTLHLQFSIGIPVMLALHIACYIFLFA
ncbi:MAG: DUF1294 domain-containing protein [Oscillospiraceae bacterium]|nr:DUF1294 domain-containing protein [Oscillospiraceae bacterium]